MCHQSLSAPFTCSYVHGPTRSAACLAQLVCQRRRVPVRSVYNLLYYGAAAHHVFLLSHAGGDNGISYALREPPLFCRHYIECPMFNRPQPRFIAGRTLAPYARLALERRRAKRRVCIAIASRHQSAWWVLSSQ